MLKVGYYSIYEIDGGKTVKYRVDSGKTLFLEFLNKTVVNKNRVVKDFTTLEKATEFAKKKMKTGIKKRKKRINKRPKDLYLILMLEESTGKTFVKVGITSKRYIASRFSKRYGYTGYVLKEILRRVKSPKSAKLEEDIKNALNCKSGINKYRPIMEKFSGYTECYNIMSLEEIISIFDSISKG